MAWVTTGLLIPSTDWQFTEPVGGTLFQLKHVTSDLPFEYFAGEICQAEIDADGTTRIFDAQPLDTQKELDVVELIKPDCFTDRRIGIRRDRHNTTMPPTNKPLVWEIEVSVYDDTPPPPPPPVEAPTANGVTYTASQSSQYSSFPLATYGVLNDGNGGTGACTNTGDSWVQATFADVVKVTAVTVGGGNIPSGFGGMANYLNTAVIQHSTDGSTWTTVATVNGVADGGSEQFKKLTLASPVESKFWRLFKTGYLGTTEFRFE